MTRTIVRFLLRMLIALIVAGIVLYLAVYALQRSSLGDDLTVALFAVVFFVGAIAFWILRVVWLARRLQRGVSRGFMSGYRRDRSDSD